MTCAFCRGVHQERLGASLAGYRLAGLVGSGGMASVYEGRHLGASRGRAAIKVLNACHRGNATLVTRFSREARASALIHAEGEHRCVVSILADGHDASGAPYLVMPLLGGVTLKQLLRERRTRPLAVNEAVDLVIDAALGLRAAHARGIVHRDVKPANLFAVRSRGRVERCVVLDFGIAKFLDEVEAEGVTGSNGAPGTPEYMALEQFFGSADRRSDVYGLGAVLYELLSGEPLRRKGEYGPSLRERVARARWFELGRRRPELPANLVELASFATEEDPSARTQDMAEVIGALQSWGTPGRWEVLPIDEASIPESGSTAPTVGTPVRPPAKLVWNRSPASANAPKRSSRRTTRLVLLSAMATAAAVAGTEASGPAHPAAREPAVPQEPTALASTPPVSPPAEVPHVPASLVSASRPESAPPSPSASQAVARPHETARKRIAEPAPVRPRFVGIRVSGLE